MLFDLMNEIDHQQRREQRAFARLLVAEQHDPADDADDAQRGQEILPVGGETREQGHCQSFDVYLSVGLLRD
jgi:hypothetical protein